MTAARGPLFDLGALDPQATAFFRFTPLGGRVLVTSDAGQYSFLSTDEFRDFTAGRLAPDSPIGLDLADKGFLRAGFDVERESARLRRKTAFLGQGPALHAVVTTLRCNQSCRYCHASRADMGRVDTDMSLDTARQVVDFAFRCPAPGFGFEFQGGEPTVNFDAIRFVCDYANEKNRYEGRALVFSVVTDLTAMTEEKMDFLLDRGVMICTSLDGPEDLHDRNRPWRKGSSAFREVLGWIERIHQRYAALGLDPDLFHVDALMTTTRQSFGRVREIIDQYVALGLKSIHLRPLNPYGFATAAWQSIGYDRDEFLDFYREGLEYIIQLNRQGIEIQERAAAIFLTKILTEGDPNYADCRSPGGNALAQLAYSYDGSIYTSDEGRMMGHMGNDLARVGHVASSTWSDVMRHPTVRALAVASTLDALPLCCDCAFKPYCGVDPLNNLMMEGDLFGQRPRSPLHIERQGQLRMLFEALSRDADGSLHRIFRRWTLQRSRPGTVPTPPRTPARRPAAPLPEAPEP